MNMRDLPAAERNVVIVGGGFAGTNLAKALQHRLPSDYRVVLLSEESYTTFNPMLPEAVGASVFPEHVVAPLREVLDIRMGSRFVMGHVTWVDCAAKTLACTTLAGPLTLAYEHLVFAFGNRARTDFLPGMEAHALPLKTIGDALEIRNTVLRRLARIELESDPAERAALGHFVVIGGGFSGVEVAGELVDYIRSARRYYPGVGADETQVTIVQDIDRLLPELPASLGDAAQRSLAARGVVIRLGARAAEIDEDGVRLTAGDRLRAATVICTIGTKPNALVAALGLPAERGRIVVQPDLSVAGVSGAWAAGDCAQVVNAEDGKVSPPTAQFAVRQARWLARNILATIASEPTTPFRYRSRGSMAGIGHLNGVAEVFGIRLTGLPAWLLWRAYYLSQMPTLGRKVRIYVEWTWGMFFPVDVTHLRFTRSRDVEKATV
jgi:NADH dehydrogenase